MGPLPFAALAIALGSSIPARTSTDASVALLAQQAADASAHGRYQEALDTYRKAVTLMGDDSPDLPTTLNNIAELTRLLGGLREAESLHRRTLALRERRYGPDHQEVAQSLNNLGETLRDQRRFHAAEAMELRALAITERKAGITHELTAIVLTNLGQTLIQQRRYEDAEQSLGRASAIWETLGDTGPRAAISMNNLAVIYSQTGRRDRAEALYLRVRERMMKSLGDDHPYVAAITLNLAELYRAEKRYDESMRQFERALGVYTARLPADHPLLTRTLAGYAAVLRANGRGREAKIAMARSRESRRSHDRDDGSAWVVDARELAR